MMYIFKKQRLTDVLDCKCIWDAWIMRSVSVIRSRGIDSIAETFSDINHTYPVAVKTISGINVLTRI